MTPVLAIDPGRCTGWAAVGDVGLLACGWLDLPQPGVNLPPPPLQGPKRVVVEIPQVYLPRQSKGNPADLVKLSYLAGEVRRAWHVPGDSVICVLPRTWKGTIPKEIHHPRIWGALSEAEKSTVDLAVRGLAPAKRHNVMDAVGLAKWYWTHPEALSEV